MVQTNLRKRNQFEPVDDLLEPSGGPEEVMKVI